MYRWHQRNLDVEKETGVGPLREQRWSEGKLEGDEGDIDEEAETEEREIGQ